MDSVGYEFYVHVRVEQGCNDQARLSVMYRPHRVEDVSQPIDAPAKRLLCKFERGIRMADRNVHSEGYQFFYEGLSSGNLRRYCYSLDDTRLSPNKLQDRAVHSCESTLAVLRT